MTLFRCFRLLMTGLALCLGALSTNAFALMGGSIQNGNVALGKNLGAWLVRATAE